MHVYKRSWLRLAPDTSFSQLAATHLAIDPSVFSFEATVDPEMSTDFDISDDDGDYYDDEEMIDGTQDEDDGQWSWN